MRIAAVLIGATLACEQAPEPAPQPTLASDPSMRPAVAARPLPATDISIAALQGAWSADRENFVWVIEGDSILFEADMLRHPFTLAGDTLLIERGDSSAPIQKTRVVIATTDSMIIQDAMTGTTETLFRLR